VNAIVILFTVGLILLGFEVFVPGAVLGILGGLALLGGCVVAFVSHGTAGGLTALAIASALVGVMLYLEFVVLPKTRWGRRLFLNTAISGTSQAVPASAASLVGHAAEALTTLAPSGYVAIEGQRYEAFSQSGLVEKGTPLRVVAVDNFRVIVART
jgi:membrane-bound ClpP family serine protease